MSTAPETVLPVLRMLLKSAARHQTLALNQLYYGTDSVISNAEEGDLGLS